MRQLITFSIKTNFMLNLISMTYVYNLNFDIAILIILIPRVIRADESIMSLLKKIRMKSEKRWN